MKLGQLVDTSVKLGMRLDPRGPGGLRRQMDERRNEYDSLPDWRKKFYDTERFTNPFGDVRLVHGSPDTEIGSVLLGVDIHVEELLLADHLRSRGERIDAVIAHHAHGVGIGPALSWDTMPAMVAMMVAEGVPPADAEASIHPYIDRRLRELDDFHRLGPDLAELLSIPLALIHSPADYYIGVGVRKVLDAARPDTVEDVIAALVTMPEVASSARIGVLPRTTSGSEARPAGRMLLKFGGGYILPPSAYPLLGKAGVNTVLQIHSTPEHEAAAEEAGITIVRIPHTACDNIGINLLLDDVEAELGQLRVVGCGGFERISRR